MEFNNIAIFMTFLLILAIQGCCVGPVDLQPYERETGVFDPGGIRIRLDFVNSGVRENYAAEDMARLARWIIDSWEEVNYSNLERVTECISDQHIIVADDYRYEQYCSETSGGCMFWPNELCSVVDGEFAWIVRERHYEDGIYGLFVHEMVHGAAGCGFDDANGDHDDERLWASLNNESIQARAMQKEQAWLESERQISLLSLIIR